MTDTVLVIGATGFTGKLVLKYLAEHPERSSFRLQAGGRSLQKLEGVIAEAGLKNVDVVVVDTLVYEQVNKAVLGAHVIINCAGPFHRYGTNVVAACARNGRQYVDITGENFWIKNMITKFDFVAFKNGATIIPSCGYDSIPSDLAALISVQSLKKLIGPEGTVADSVTAHKISGGVSGGTLATILDFIGGGVPKEDLQAVSDPCSLSPVQGKPGLGMRLTYSMPHLTTPVLNGGFFVMSIANEAIVRRSWGLFQTLPPLEERSSLAWGEDFTYGEFFQTPSAVAGFLLSSFLGLGAALLVMFPPARWLFKKLTPPPGTGPSQEVMDKSRMTITNVTSSSGPNPRRVKTVIHGKGDPGYKLTAMFLSESGLSLLPKNKSLLPSLGRQGGLLTPATALGNILVDRLVKTGYFSFTSEELLDGGATKGQELL